MTNETSRYNESDVGRREQGGDDEPCIQAYEFGGRGRKRHFSRRNDSAARPDFTRAKFESDWRKMGSRRRGRNFSGPQSRKHRRIDWRVSALARSRRCRRGGRREKRIRELAAG